jgi:hypothetical protein
MGDRIGGTITIKVDGVQYLAKGSFSYNLGKPKKTGVTGSDLLVHGYKEEPQTPYIEGEITDTASLDLATFQDITDATVMLTKPNGKIVVIRNAWYAGEGKGETEEGKLDFKFEGLSGEEM